MGYLLLTGATGLLGRFVLRDLLLENTPVVVITRSTRAHSARLRIDDLVSQFEDLLGQVLPRPIVIEGDLIEPDLAIAPLDAVRIGEICDRVCHCAASIQFQRDQQDEPFRTNVVGTKHLLRFCGERGIRTFFHVSTAYVCGKRRGLVTEDSPTEDSTSDDSPSNELELGNDYESSKFESERLVLDAANLVRPTIFRPSIIVGDSTTGFTSTFHGFYSPLRLGLMLAKEIGYQVQGGELLLRELQLDGTERKNFVPVDWVAGTIRRVIANPELHGKVYHLTNPEGVLASVVTRVISDVVREVITAGAHDNALSNPVHEPVNSGNQTSASGLGSAESSARGEFQAGMQVYQSYLRDDPIFDRRNLQSIPGLPDCPRVDYDLLYRLARYALSVNFGWPRRPTIFPKHDFANWIGCQNEPGKFDSSDVRFLSNSPADSDLTDWSIGLEVAGAGGGGWQLVIRGDCIAAKLGIDDTADAVVYTTTETLVAILEKRVTFDDARQHGRLVIFGNAASIDRTVDSFWKVESFLSRSASTKCLSLLDQKEPHAKTMELAG